MSYFVKGSSFGAIDQPRDRYQENSDGSFDVVRTYRTIYETWQSTKPRRQSAHPVYPDAKLETVDCEQLSECGVLCDVTLTYKAPKTEDEVTEEGSDTQDPPEPGAALPPDEYTESAVDAEAPIEAHPDFATFGTVENGAIFDENGLFRGWEADSAFSGQLTYKAKKLTKTETKYFWAKPGSVASFVGDRSGNWLCVSGSIARRGVYWTRSLNWEYNAAGWNTTIYP